MIYKNPHSHEANAGMRNIDFHYDLNKTIPQLEVLVK